MIGREFCLLQSDKRADTKEKAASRVAGLKVSQVFRFIGIDCNGAGVCVVERVYVVIHRVKEFKICATSMCSALPAFG